LVWLKAPTFMKQMGNYWVDGSGDLKLTYESGRIGFKGLWSTVLSACAEDHRLCLWMNAQNVTEYFMHPSMTASADSAEEHGGATGFARAALLGYLGSLC